MTLVNTIRNISKERKLLNKNKAKCLPKPLLQKNRRWKLIFRNCSSKLYRICLVIRCSSVIRWLNTKKSFSKKRWKEPLPVQNRKISNLLKFIYKFSNLKYWFFFFFLLKGVFGIGDKSSILLGIDFWMLLSLYCFSKGIFLEFPKSLISIESFFL